MATNITLSCLSKGLERVIARRMAHAALKHGILHPNQAGALPKRSAVDIVVSLIYDIEKALAAGQVATLVTEDVMGAFDAILRNRMILRLRQQGWADFLIHHPFPLFSAIYATDSRAPAGPRTKTKRQQLLA